MKRISAFLIFIVTCTAGMLISGDVLADIAKINPNKIDTLKLDSLYVLPPVLDAVPYVNVSDSDPVDTLNTPDEHIKMIIYRNKTWRYSNISGCNKPSNVFNERWILGSTDPYGIPKEKIEDEYALILVDTLADYHYPFTGNISYRSKFGMRRGRRHQGVDLHLRTGDPVYATFPGKVRHARYNSGGYGNLVIIRHANGLETYYAHLSSMNVSEEDWVEAGDVIGLGGSTGRSSGPHLHFETRFKGFPIDPEWIIDFKTGKLRDKFFVLQKEYMSFYVYYDQQFEENPSVTPQSRPHVKPEIKPSDKPRPKTSTKPQWYVVKEGDTLGRIALENKTSVSAICKLNNMSETDVLAIGRRLKLR